MLRHKLTGKVLVKIVTIRGDMNRLRFLCEGYVSGLCLQYDQSCNEW